MECKWIKKDNLIANEEYTCVLCGEKIAIGEKIIRNTLNHNGYLYERVSHMACSKIAHELDMFKRSGRDGLDLECFAEFIMQYILEAHKNSFPFVDKRLLSPSLYERVLKIEEELDEKAKV